MKFEWSEYQKNIFSFVENGKGNAIVEAVAGAAKTTTLLESYKRLSEDKKSIFLAFNKSIAEEMKSKGVNARTFHSLCYTAVTKKTGQSKIDTLKNWNITKKMFSDDKRAREIYEKPIVRLISILKSSGVGIIYPNNDDIYYAIMDRFSIGLDYSDIDDIEVKIHNKKSLVEKAKKAFGMSIDEEYKFGIDFDDLLYLAVKLDLNIGKYDFVFVDEAQDTAPIQREILKKIMRKESRLVAVGDPYQSIYGFRGADSDSMNLIKNEFNCISLPLHISYRCSKSVIDVAKQYCPIIEGSSFAKQGSVTYLKKSWNVSTFKDKDFILCRTNAPLISLCYMLIVNKVPARILGKDIAENLISLIEKLSKDGRMKIYTFSKKLDAWYEKEKEKKRLEESKSMYGVKDRYECIKSLMSNFDSSDDVDKLVNTLRSMFNNAYATVTLSSIHKAKGLESDRVFWLNSEKEIKTHHDWEISQETNMKYVAVTRAKSELFFIDSLENE